jgi:hypothetical protein
MVELICLITGATGASGGAAGGSCVNKAAECAGSSARTIREQRRPGTKMCRRRVTAATCVQGTTIKG